MNNAPTQDLESNFIFFIKVVYIFSFKNLIEPEIFQGELFRATISIMQLTESFQSGCYKRTKPGNSLEISPIGVLVKPTRREP